MGGRGSFGGNKTSGSSSSTTGGFKLNSNIKSKLDELNSRAEALGVTDRRLVVGYAPDTGERVTLYIQYSDGTRSEKPAAYINSVSEAGTPWVVVGEKTKRTVNSAINAIFPVDPRFKTR